MERLEQQINSNSGKTDACSCIHCGNLCPEPKMDFCCDGCKHVYHFIQSCDLGAYYRLKEKSKRVEEQKAREFFEDFDHPDLKKKYLKKLENYFELRVFVEGIHCSACIWILEKLPELVENCYSAKLNMSDNCLRMLVSEEVKISDILFYIQNFGYKAQALKTDEKTEEKLKHLRKSYLIKLGITAALTGNIMLMTTSVYGGAIDNFKDQFHWISFFLSLGIVFYSANDFYKNSIRAFKQKSFSVDYSLSIAIVLGFLISTYNLVTDGEYIYYDSIASLCFLILASRYFLSYSKWQNQLNPESGHPLLPRLVFSKNSEAQWVKTVPEKLEVNSIIKIEEGQRLPADGKLLSSKAYLDESILTGESESIEKNKDQEVWAGTLNLGNTFEYIASSNSENSKIFNILKESKINSSDSYVETAQSYAKVLSIVSHLMAAVALVYGGVFMNNWHWGFGIALAILIISCPCAFAIATPLSLQRANQKLKKLGVLARNIEAIEKLTNVKNIFFDKTGTLTEDSFSISSFEWNQNYDEKEILSLASQMESISGHPIAKAIRLQCISSLKQAPVLKEMKILEIPGLGVCAKYLGDNYEIKRNTEVKETNTVSLYKNKEILASWTFSNQIKNQSHLLIEELNANYKVHILSGDHKKEVIRVANALKINGSSFAQQKPEDKESVIGRHNNTLMIGDGVNDTLALKKADVAIATQGSIELAFRSSHFYLKSTDIESVPKILGLAKALKKNIDSNYLFSICFNIIGITLAFGGYITPLAAAILMPISSLILSLKSFYKVQIPQTAREGIWKS